MIDPVGEPLLHGLLLQRAIVHLREKSLRGRADAKRTRERKKNTISIDDYVLYFIFN